MVNIKVTRHGAGSYTVRDAANREEDAAVRVYRQPEIPGGAKWMARAEWDRHCYTDPMWTKAEAVKQAEFMLGDISGKFGPDA